jgi:hypothetical protein
VSNFSLATPDLSFTGGFVGEHEAGQRLFQVVHDPRCAKSGVYWSWNGGPREGRGVAALEKGGQISGGGGAGGGWDSIFENDQSAKVLDVETQLKLFQYASAITDAKWPDIRAITSPCPTLKVISAVTKSMVQREELKRIREMGQPGMNADGSLISIPEISLPTVSAVSSESSSVIDAISTPAAVVSSTKPKKRSVKQKVLLVVDTVVSTVLSNTVGRVARFIGKRLLGEIPDTAYDVRISVPPSLALSSLDDAELLSPPEAAQYMQLESADQDPATLEEAIKEYLAQEKNEGAGVVSDVEDEALFQQIARSKQEEAAVV